MDITFNVNFNLTAEAKALVGKKALTTGGLPAAGGLPHPQVGDLVAFECEGDKLTLLVVAREFDFRVTNKLGFNLTMDVPR